MATNLLLQHIRVLPCCIDQNIQIYENTGDYNTEVTETSMQEFCKSYILETMVKKNQHVSKIVRSSPPEVFLGKGVPKICSKFTGEHSCQSVISIKLLCDFIKTAL